MRGQPGHNTRPHAGLPLCFLGMNVWMTSQLNVAMIIATLVIIVLSLSV